jgi:hypothetical protein
MPAHDVYNTVYKSIVTNVDTVPNVEINTDQTGY